MEPRSPWYDVLVQAGGNLVAAAGIAVIACVIGVGSYTPVLRYYVLSGLAGVLILLATYLVGFKIAVVLLDVFPVRNTPGPRFDRHAFRGIAKRTAENLVVLVSVLLWLAIAGLISYLVAPLIAEWVGYKP